MMNHRELDLVDRVRVSEAFATAAGLMRDECGLYDSAEWVSGPDLRTRLPVEGNRRKLRIA